jgi:hypothetical protein
MACAEWASPMISFDLREPVLTEPQETLIRKLNAHFKKNRPDYRLVDYGVLEIS